MYRLVIYIYMYRLVISIYMYRLVISMYRLVISIVNINRLIITRSHINVRSH